MTRKTVLITGASAGIGAASARLLAQHGYDVGLGYRSDQAGAEAVAADVEAAGGTAVLLQGDMADPADIDRIFADFDAAFPRLDALVNNAGISAAGRFEALELDAMLKVIDINLTGAIVLTNGLL
ncbi:MAG: SDR family oxidoreductase, partial [Pseudomonadota bacterium]